VDEVLVEERASTSNDLRLYDDQLTIANEGGRGLASSTGQRPSLQWRSKDLESLVAEEVLHEGRMFDEGREIARLDDSATATRPDCR
jgi:hypothetical protein